MIPVLLVDDDRELTEMLSLYLAREGFQATAVDTGEEGETQALSGHFQVVLLGGALCLLLDRLLWLGSGALAVFMLLTIVIVHTFWNKHGAEQQLALFFALEHLSVVGGLICAAIASHARAQKNSSSNR